MLAQNLMAFGQGKTAAKKNSANQLIVRGYEGYNIPFGYGLPVFHETYVDDV